MSVEEYAKKILEEHGCDIYTYDGEYSRRLLDDLKEEYPNGMDFPYIDVANAILAISRPVPIIRSPWKVIWDTDSCCDSFSAESFEEAENAALDTYILWMCQEVSEWKSEIPSEQERENWNYMIYNCDVSIAKYNPQTDEYDICKEFSEQELEDIGWKEI